MRVSNFLFPQSTTAADDARVIDETLREAKLTDELGFDVIWLAEHHFDGICAYVDPVSFAAALATATQHAKIGFAVAQMALHHPIRMAEQISLIDHLSKGRLIVGLGRGTAYNIYDYQGFGIDHTEAQARFEEAEAIMFEAWKGEAFEHHGEYFNLKLPAFRPVPFTKPHPYVIRAAATEHGMLDIAQTRPPVHDERAKQRNDRATDGPVPPDVALHRPGRGRQSPRTPMPVGRGATCSSRRRMPKRNGSPFPRSTRCTSTAWRCGSGSIRSKGVSIVPMPAPGAAPPARMVLEHSLGLRFAGDGGGETRRGRQDRHRRADHAVPPRARWRTRTPRTA